MNVVRSSFVDPLRPLVAKTPLLGESEAMREVVRLIDRVGPTEAAVFLTGESGSGKELAATWIHDRSPRRNGPFIVINCGAIPAGLIESELFGCEKGSFGGGREYTGVFERAQGGTLLLDEITEMPMEMQTRLLRVLETRRFYRVGAHAEIGADVRVISSTNRCPLQAVGGGQLREDLLYRLAVFPIELPPLRHRGNDVDMLADRFLAELNAGALRLALPLSRDVERALVGYPWPGNVRELKNCIERAFILGDHVIEVAPLLQIGSARAPAAGGDRERLDIRVGSRIHDMERSLIEATLNYFKGNKRRAADALGCSLKTLYNKLNGYSQSPACARN